MSVLDNELSGSGVDLFPAGRFILEQRPGLVGRGARGAGADACIRSVLRAAVFHSLVTGVSLQMFADTTS